MADLACADPTVFVSPSTDGTYTLNQMGDLSWTVDLIRSPSATGIVTFTVLCTSTSDVIDEIDINTSSPFATRVSATGPTSTQSFASLRLMRTTGGGMSTLLLLRVNGDLGEVDVPGVLPAVSVTSATTIAVGGDVLGDIVVTDGQLVDLDVGSDLLNDIDVQANLIGPSESLDSVTIQHYGPIYVSGEEPYFRVEFKPRWAPSVWQDKTSLFEVDTTRTATGSGSNNRIAVIKATSSNGNGFKVSGWWRIRPLAGKVKCDGVSGTSGNPDVQWDSSVVSGDLGEATAGTPST